MKHNRIKSINRISWKVFLIPTLLFSCASSKRHISIPLDPLSPAPRVDNGFVKDHEVLSAYLLKNKADVPVVQDVQFILDAMVAERNGQLDIAISHWFRAMEVAQGAFGEKAFVGWLKAFTKKQGKKFERAELAKIIFLESKSGSKSLYMQERGIQSEEKLVPILLKEVSDFIEGEIVSENIKIDAPLDVNLLASDPLLTRLALEVCKYKSQFGVGWEAWRQVMTVDVSKYFDALVGQCSGQSAKSLTLFAEVAPKLALQANTAHYALESYARMIKIRRDQGERETVAPLYLPFMQLWKNPNITELTLGLSRSAFEQRRIDDTMWAARSRASIGDGETAKYFADDVVMYVNAALTQSYTLTQDQKNSLASNAAETYHLLAFRLAVESKDWDKAYNITLLALEQPALNDEWTNRLKWSLGLYKYLANDFEAARRLWENLLTETTEDRLRPQLLFWTSQAHKQLKNETEAAFYRKTLAEDFPLSFYSVVGLSQSKGEYESKWQSAFADVNGLRAQIKDWQKTDIEDLRSDKYRGRLLRRAEIFGALGLVPFTSYALEELQKSFDIKSGEREVEWGIYLSRLYAASGQWIGAISLTTKLSKDPEFWRKRPEQMLIYFPRPYLDTYQTVAKELSTDADLLFGITRQESSFKADIKSSANAWGLMQLTPPTARRLLPVAGMTDPSTVQIPEALIRPEINVRLGASFLRELFVKYSDDRPKVFAAYNAGANTADHWSARRVFEDPLVFIEMIPYLETRDYVKSVWRNELVYRYLTQSTSSHK